MDTPRKFSLNKDSIVAQKVKRLFSYSILFFKRSNLNRAPKKLNPDMDKVFNARASVRILHQPQEVAAKAN